jgi:hypothetical protein
MAGVVRNSISRQLTAIVFSVFKTDAVKALADGARGFVGGQKALARRRHADRDFVELIDVHDRRPPLEDKCGEARRIECVFRPERAKGQALVPKRFHARQSLALKPFQKRAPCRRDKGEVTLRLPPD